MIMSTTTMIMIVIVITFIMRNVTLTLTTKRMNITITPERIISNLGVDPLHQRNHIILRRGGQEIRDLQSLKLIGRSSGN